MSSLPGWQAVHPILIHLAIPVLLLAPLFIVLAVAWHKTPSVPLLRTALALVAAGTIFLYFAGCTAETAENVARESFRVQAVLKEHRELADITRTSFAALTVILAAILYGPRLFQKQARRVIATSLPVIYLLLYAAGVVTLAHTMRQGGLLLHEMEAQGIHQSAPTIVRAAQGD